MQTGTVGYVTGGFVLIIFPGNVSRLINNGELGQFSGALNELNEQFTKRLRHARCADLYSS